MTKNSIYFFILAFVIFACGNNKTVTYPPLNLTCENQINPLGIDNPKPVFGWQLNDSSIGSAQSAYQVIVASGEDFLNIEKADIWNSGKVISNQSQYIAYSGKKLESSKRYYWEVQNFDSAGNALGFSNPAWFETGFMKPDDWKAPWIKAPKILENASSILFRKEFPISKKIKQVRVYATGLGAYIFYINGKKVGNQYLSPGWTVFKKRLQYQTYDITNLINNGSNAVGAVIADFWTSSIGSNKPGLRFLMEMKIDYEDGSTEWINSSDEWKCNFSPVKECFYEGGEKYDSRLEQNGWNYPGFDDKNWTKVVTEKNNFNLVSQQLQPITVKQELKTLKIFKPEGNRYVFDFGETLPGWVKINIKSKRGSSIKLKYLSAFNEKTNTGKVVATDEYICNSDHNETWEPLFAYHIFRFIELTGLTGNPDSNIIKARIAYPDMPVIGHFSCSNELVNKIYDNIIRTGRNNLVSMLTGFPGIESYKGSPVSAQAYAMTALYTYDMKRAFSKYIQDLCDLQGDDGRIHFLPAEGSNNNSPGWPEVMVFLPWKTYLAIGDKRILENNYEAIKKWHDSQVRESDASAPPYMRDREGNGDIFATEITPVKPIGSTYYFYTTSMLSDIANVLDKPDEATSFMELSGFTKDQFNQSYLTYRTARYWANTQTAHVLPLVAGLTPLSHVQRVGNFIASDIIKHDIHPTTGVLATQYLLPLLSQYNHHELAYKLITQTSKPSWGYMIEKGSSIIWGSWDGDDETSYYQLSLASVGEWLYSYLAGIRPDPKNPGYKHSIIDPNPTGDLKWVDASINTNYGKLSVFWEKQDKNLLIKVNIPPNTTSTLTLPVASSKKAKVFFEGKVIVRDGKVTADCPSYIKFRGFDANMAVLDVKSGRYEFVVE